MRPRGIFGFNGRSLHTYELVSLKWYMLIEFIF
nr:MAG TPA: hypothetical protein [Bacteriophage sp.]